MKLIKLKDKNEKEYNWNLVIETLEDLELYSKLDFKIAVEDAGNLWKDIKENENLNINEYSKGKHPIVKWCHFRLNYKSTKETTLTEYSHIIDETHHKKYLGIKQIIDSGKSVRTNYNGGYNIFDINYDVLDVIECNSDALYAYLTSGKVNEPDLSIDKEVLIIENDKKATEWSLDKAKQLNKEYQIIDRLDVRMLNKSGKDIYNLFDKGIKNKLNTIIVETTLLHTAQYEQIKAILEHVMTDNKDKTLNIHLKLNALDTNIETKCSNIKLNLYNF